MLGLLVLLLLLPNRCSSLTRSGVGTKWPLFSHKIVLTNVLNVTENADSALRCVELCFENVACVSVFYRLISRRCQFHDVLFLSPQDGEKEEGTEYYSLTTGSCPTGYVQARTVDLCYRHELNKISYGEIFADCASRGEHMIVIDSQEKQDHFRKQMFSTSVSRSSSYYIDGSDAETEGQWEFHDGRLMTFSAWGEGYPKNLTTRWNYILASKMDGALWRDNGKGEKKYYMCEKDIS